MTQAETVEASVTGSVPGSSSALSETLEPSGRVVRESDTDSAAAAVEAGSDGDLFVSEKSGMDEALSDSDSGTRERRRIVRAGPPTEKRKNRCR